MDKELYDLLLKEGMVTTDYNTFKARYSDEASRVSLFSNMKNDGLYGKTQDDFFEEYYGVKKKPTKDLSTSPSSSGTPLSTSSPVELPQNPYSWGSSGAAKITTPTYADQLKTTPGYASPETMKAIVQENKTRQEDNARLAAIDKVRAKRNGDYTKTGDEFMDDYTREQIQGTSLIESFISPEEGEATTREYKFRTEAIRADVLDLENGIAALDDQILKGLGDDAFQKQEALVTQINGLAAKLQPFEQNPPKTEKEINEYNDWAFQYGELVKQAKEFEEHPLVKERNQMAAAYDANVARVKQLLSDDRYKNVNEILGFAKERQAKADNPSLLSSVNILMPSVVGGQQILANAYARGLAGIGRLMDVAETLTTGDKKYTTTDVIQDFMIGLEEDVAMIQPTPSKFARPLRTNTVKWKDYQVDVKDGNITLRDKQGKVVDKKISSADEEEILAIPAKSQFNGYALPYKIGTTLADAGVMIFGAGKVAAPLKGVLGANMASKIGVTASTVGQMINPLYEEGMKMFNNKEKASAYALKVSTLIGISSNLFGWEAKLAGGKGGWVDDILRSTPSGKVTPVQRAMGIAQGSVGEWTEEMAIEPLIDSGVRIQMGQPAKKWDSDEFVEGTILSLSVGAIMTGATGDVKKAALHTATQNVDGFEKELRSQAEQGFIEIDEIGIQKERAKVEKVKDLMNALEAPPEIIDLVEEKVVLEEKLGRLEAANLPTEVVENQITAKNQEIMESLDRPIGSPAQDLITAFTEEVDGEKVTDFDAVREALQDPDMYNLSEEDVLEVRQMMGEAVEATQIETATPAVESTEAEAPASSSNTKLGDKIELSNGNNLVLNKEKSVKAGSDFVFDEDSYDVQDENGNNIGSINIADKGDYYQVTNAKLNNERTGLGTEIYKNIIPKLDKPLVSDKALSEKAKGLWDKLVKDGLAEKFDDVTEIGDVKYTEQRYRTISQAEQAASPGATTEVVIEPTENAMSAEETITEPTESELTSVESQAQEEMDRIIKADRAERERIDAIQDPEEQKAQWDNFIKTTLVESDKEFNKFYKMGADLSGFQETLSEADKAEYKAMNEISHRMTAMDRNNGYKPFKVTAKEKAQYAESAKKFNKLFNEYETEFNKSEEKRIADNVEEIKVAKKRLKDSLNTPLGISYDPAKHAEQVAETFNALVDLAKLYIKQGVNNVVDFAKKVGKSVLEVIDAWVAAQMKNPDLTQAKIQKLVPITIGQKTQKFVEKFFKETFTAYGQLPKDVFERNAKRIAAIDKRVSEASYIARRLQKFITPENRADVMAALQGQAELLPTVENYNELIEGVKEFRNLIDTASKEMIALGIVDGKLATTLDENMNLYVNRAYRIHSDKKWIDDVQGLPAFNKAVNWFINEQNKFIAELIDKRRIYSGYLTNAQDKLQRVENMPGALPEDVEKAQGTVDFWRDRIENLDEFARLEEMKLADPQAQVVALMREQEIDVKQNSRIGAMNLGILGKRKELPQEIRDLFGEYDDPIITAMTTVFKQANLIENFKFLADVEAMGKGKFLFEVPTGEYNKPVTSLNSMNFNPVKSDDMTTEQKKYINNQKKDAYSPLRNYYTTPEIAEAFAGKKEGIDPVVQWVTKFVSVPKYMNTIGSVMSHANNFFSGMWFHLQNGHFNAFKPKNNPFATAFKTVWADAYGDSKVYQEKMLEYIEAGIIDDGIAMGEMKDALDVYKSLYSEPEAMEMVTQRTGLGKVKKAAEWAYKSEDRVHKIVGYELEKARYEKAGLTPSEAKEMAAKRVRNGYPTYSLISKNVQRLRAVPFIATFPSFPYEVLRTTKNQMVAAYEDFQDPRTRVIGLQRAIGVSTALTLPYAISMATMAALGLDDEDEDRIRLVAPEWDKNATYLFINSNQEGATYIPFQRFIPIQQVAAPINALLNEKSETRFKDAVDQLFAPFMGTDMTTRVTMEALFNEKLDSNKKVTAQDDPENVSARIKHAMKVFYPGTFNSIVKITESYSDNNPRKREPANEWMSLFSGIRMQKLDYDQNFSFVARDLGIRKKDNKAIYYTGQRQGVDETERATLAWEKMSKSAINYVEAYRGLGLGDKEIRKSLEDHGFNKEEIKAFFLGEVPELKFSK